MKVDVYSNPRDRGFSVLVRAGSPITHLPPSVQEQGGGLVYWQSYDLNSDDERTLLDSKAAIANIEKRGYHVSKVEQKFSGTFLPNRR